MALGRILPRLSGTVSAQPACAACARPSLARLGLGLRSLCGPRPGLAQPGASMHVPRRERERRSARGAARVPRGGDITGAREAVQERARQGLTGAWMVARHELTV
jgi:hypothetical protein